MDGQVTDPGVNDREDEELVSATRRSVAERLSDPYLNDHDRWVLRQFSRFLNGITGDTGPRALPVGDPGSLEQHRVDARQP
jgi:hypothetical protein